MAKPRKRKRQQGEQQSAQQYEVLNYLLEQIAAAPDEVGVRALLRPTAA